MAKKTENKYPLTIRGMGVQLTKELAEIRKSMILLEKEAHENGLEIAEAKEAINRVDDRVTGLVQMFNGRHDVVNTRFDRINARVDELIEEANHNSDAITETFKRINRRLAVTMILSGVAIGMTLLFTAILCSAMFNVGSGGQITILFP
jgi:tetrahydromethanopterin S-methyltransferase subunit G